MQNGRLQFEAIPFVLSFRHHNPRFQGRLILLQPKPNDLWWDDPTIDDEVRELLESNGAEIVEFETVEFGSRYSNGNKIEGLKALPAGEPFVFFDTDTLFTGSIDDVPFDFDRPTASLKRENTWPKEHVYGPSVEQVWQALYEKFDLDFDASQDTEFPKGFWKRYLYFNAGWFFYKDPAEFGRLFTKYATEILNDTPAEVYAQNMFPWLDQIALPLVIHALGGAKHTIPDGLLDGSISCHYRVLPLLYARESDDTIEFFEELLAHNKIKKVLKKYEPFKKLLYQKKGHQVRALFNQRNLPRKEMPMRKKIKEAKLWMR